MRKAGLKNRSRRSRTSNGNGGPNPSSGNGQNYGGSLEGGQQLGGGNGGVGERRKPTTEEAALTAKNYRLAKELSDLRVRHRDETRVVTRLTMENMNLASRCREAISHVAMLKKELATQQRRASEMMALQVQQSNRMPATKSTAVKSSPLGDKPENTTAPSAAAVPSGVATDLHNNLSLSTAQLPHPKQPGQQPYTNTSAPKDLTAGQHRGFDLGYDNVGKASLSEPSSIPKESTVRREPKPKRTQSSQQKQQSVSNDDTFDPTHTIGLPKKPNRYQSTSQIDDFKAPLDDAPADEMLLDEVPGFNAPTDFFAHSKAPGLPTTPERGDLDDSLDSAFSVPQFQTDPSKRGNRKKEGKDPDAHIPQSPKFSNSAVLNQNKKSLSSSIDAFEASFNAAFPSTFLGTTDEAPPSLDMAFDVPEFSDPFFLGSVDGGGASSSSTFHENHSGSPSVEKLEMPMNKNEETDRVKSPYKTAAANNAHDIGVFGTGEASLSDTGNIVVEKSPPPQVGPQSNQEWNGVDETSRRNPKEGFPTGTNTVDNDSPSPSNLFPESAMSTFELMSDQGQYRTPGKSAREKQSFEPVDELFNTPPVNAPAASAPDVPTASPQRPEKVASSSVRARYDAALNIKASSRTKLDQQQNQPQNPKPKSSEGSRPETNHSPSLVLRRLHQRRAKDKVNNSPSPEESSGDAPPESAVGRTGPVSYSKGISHENNKSVGNLTGGRLERRLSDENGFSSPDTKEQQSVLVKNNGIRGSSKISNYQKALSAKNFSNQGTNAGTHFRRSISARHGNKMSPDTMNAEIRQLDAIANASSTSDPSAPADAPSGLSSTYSKRRNVKQPISYTEPSLNSKLRRGDVYFPKTDSRGRGKDGQLGPIRAPAESNPVDPDDLTGQSSKNSDEVLKDLVASSATPVVT